MQGSMHVSGTYGWKNQGGRRGVLVFKGGSSLPPARGVGSTLPPCELARSRPAERPSHCAIRHRSSAISLSFSRETWSLTVSALKIGEI